MSLRSAPKRGFNFDYIMWLFTRLSALAMYLLAFIGLVGALIMGARQNMNLADLMRWTFMPEVTHVQNTNVANIDAWKSVFWQGMGILFVFVASAHGLHGLLNVIEDYLENATARKILRYLVIPPALVALNVVAIYVILHS
jgi:succinate dehydrogenase hydrophobic anchor subunit